MADNDYLYEIIDDETNARHCARLLAEEFCAHNSITKFDQASPEDYFNECSWILTKEMFPERLSFLVRHRSTGEIIGALLAGDLYKQYDKSDNISKELYTMPLDHLLEELDELFIKHDFKQELKPNMVLHIEMCAIQFQHSGKGIANRLNKVACEYARDKQGFQYALAQVTDNATRHIYLNKMNGKEMSVIDPKSWVWENENNELIYPFKDFKGSSIPNILMKL